MPRPILNSTVKSETQPLLNAKPVVGANIELSGVALEKRLRQKRSAAYIEALTKLDATGVQCDHGMVQDLIQAIQSEFPELKPHQFPIGLVSKCYLGEPYEVHTLDVRLEIVNHFKRGEPLPAELEKARSIAVHPGYAYIEVYSDSICAVTISGTVSVIKG